MYRRFQEMLHFFLPVKSVNELYILLFIKAFDQIGGTSINEFQAPRAFCLLPFLKQSLLNEPKMCE
jgi:hypothetical protein